MEIISELQASMTYSFVIMTLIKTVKSFLYCKYIGLCCALGEPIHDSVRDGVDKGGSHAGKTYRMQKACDRWTLV